MTDQLSSFLHHSNSIYYIKLDAQGRYCYANKLFLQIFARKTDEVINNPFCNDILPEDVELCNEAMQDCQENPGDSVCVDLRKLRKDGSMFWTRWEFCATMDNDRKLAGIQGIGNDITERKRAESENQKAQESLKLLLDNTEEAFILIDNNLEIVSFNREADARMLELFGKHLRKGFPIFDYVAPERIAALKKMYESILQGNEHQTELEVPFNGKKLIYFSHFKPVLNHDEQVIAVIITSRNITEHKIAQEKLVQNERHFRSLIENSADAVTILSPEGEVYDISPSAERILGHSRELMTREDPQALIHPEDLP